MGRRRPALLQAPVEIKGKNIDQQLCKAAAVDHQKVGAGVAKAPPATPPTTPASTAFPQGLNMCHLSLHLNSWVLDYDYGPMH